MTTRSTRTYAILDVSSECYREIREKLKTAAYDHAFQSNGVIDMHGIALREGQVIGKLSPAFKRGKKFEKVDRP